MRITGQPSFAVVFSNNNRNNRVYHGNGIRWPMITLEHVDMAQLKGLSLIWHLDNVLHIADSFLDNMGATITSTQRITLKRQQDKNLLTNMELTWSDLSIEHLLHADLNYFQLFMGQM